MTHHLRWSVFKSWCAPLVPPVLPQVVSWLSFPWLKAVQTCPLELKEGHGSWSLAYKKWGAERSPCLGAPQGPAWFQSEYHLFVLPLLACQMGMTRDVCMYVSCSVMPDSLWPRGLQPTRFLCPWDSSGKNTGVGCHFFLRGNLPDLGIEPESPPSRALAGRFFTTESPGKPITSDSSDQFMTANPTSLAGYSPWDLKESDMTEWLTHTHTHTHTHNHIMWELSQLTYLKHSVCHSSWQQ